MKFIAEISYSFRICTFIFHALVSDFELSACEIYVYFHCTFNGLFHAVSFTIQCDSKRRTQFCMSIVPELYMVCG